jgi:DNA-binding IclR family transcriptional regulator
MPTKIPATPKVADPTARSTPAARVRPVPAVTRALAILRLLGRHSEPLTLKTIATDLGMVPSTCLHILRVLVEEGLVKADTATKRYSLGVGMLALARSVIDSSPFAALVQPVLDHISASWNVTTIGVEIRGADDLVVLALARPNTPFRLHVDVGSRFPAMTSATGRLVAAHTDISEAELRRRFSAAQWDQAPNWESWLKEVETVRRRGYSIDRGNYIGGITVLAVPIFDRHGHVTHAIVAAGVADQISGAKSASLAQDLKTEAQSLSQLMNIRG